MVVPVVIGGFALLDGAVVVQCLLALRDFERRRESRERSERPLDPQRH